MAYKANQSIVHHPAYGLVQYAALVFLAVLASLFVSPSANAGEDEYDSYESYCEGLGKGCEAFSMDVYADLEQLVFAAGEGEYVDLVGGSTGWTMIDMGINYGGDVCNPECRSGYFWQTGQVHGENWLSTLVSSSDAATPILSLSALSQHGRLAIGSDKESLKK